MSCFDMPQSAAVDDLVYDLQHAFFQLRDEAMKALDANGYTLWPEEINQGGWGVHGMHWQGEPQPNLAPVATALVGKHQPLVTNAAFSLLLPGAEIAEHQGYTGAVIRLHFTLLAPTEAGCDLICDGERRSWCDRGVFCFDDTKLHSAYNRTSQIRIILILDLRRDAL